MISDQPLFLLGITYGALLKIQDHLMQERYKDALTHINDTIRFLVSEINKPEEPNKVICEHSGIEFESRECKL